MKYLLGEQKMSTVTVLCKKPYGVELQVGNQKVTLNGYNSSAVAHGYGITENVPKELWDAWVEQHKGHKLYTSGCVAAQETTRNAKAQAKDTAELKTGTERIKQGKHAGVEKDADAGKGV